MNKNLLHINFCFLALMISFSVSGKEGKLLLKNQEIFENLIQTKGIQIEELTVEKYKSELIQSISFLKTKKERFSNDNRFLEYVFYYVHRVYLKKYRPYQSFEKLFNKGEYGCLTGTALYAIVLEELDYEIEIRETNYHVFLMVKSSEDYWILESTDPLYGFISDEKQIAEKLKSVSANNRLSQNNRTYQFGCKINRAISLNELIGLQYYNVSTQYYNQGHFELALYFLQKSKLTYRSARQKEFFELINAQKNIIFQNKLASVE